MYPPHLGVGDFLGWLELYEAQNGPDSPNATPLYIPATMRRKMQVAFCHPVYAAILMEQIQDIRRPIYFLGGPDELDYQEGVEVDVESSDEEASNPGDVSNSDSSQTGSSDSGVCNIEGQETVEAADGGWVLEVPQFAEEEMEMGDERVVVERDTSQTDSEDPVEESLEDIKERFCLSEEDREKMKPGQWERIFEEVEAAIASGVYDDSEDDVMSVLSEGDAE